MMLFSNEYVAFTINPFGFLNVRFGLLNVQVLFKGPPSLWLDQVPCNSVSDITQSDLSFVFLSVVLLSGFGSTLPVSLFLRFPISLPLLHGYSE